MSPNKHESPAFEDLIARIDSEAIETWSKIEKHFIETVEEFDQEYASGLRPSGWYQAKARYFNDIIVLLLRNVSGRDVGRRCKKKSQLFEQIDIDICFPLDGVPVIAGEVKALGTPPHPGNKNTARAGAQDLHKRIREVAFTSTDLKAAYAPPQPIGSFQQWIDSTSPGYFAFWAVRANDKNDLESLRSTFTRLRAYCNGVGAVVYTPRAGGTPTQYESRALPGMSIDRAIREMAQRIA